MLQEEKWIDKERKRLAGVPEELKQLETEAKRPDLDKVKAERLQKHVLAQQKYKEDQAALQAKIDSHNVRRQILRDDMAGAERTMALFLEL